MIFDPFAGDRQKHEERRRETNRVLDKPLTMLPPKEKTFPVMEAFGPTLQGEGALAGSPTMFVRFGGCDYRCSWCDSLFSVLPAEVRANAVKQTAEEIVENLVTLVGSRGSKMWVTLSGGNPALMDFDPRPGEYAFIAGLQRNGFKVAVETQGSVWREWLSEVDHLTVSPKPPSSGMATPEHKRQTEDFLEKAVTLVPLNRRSMKIVVFDDADLSYARWMFKANPDWDKYLSAGTDQIPNNDSAVVRHICERYAWLAERVAADPDFTDARVLPQLHVLAWGMRRGV